MRSPASGSSGTATIDAVATQGLSRFSFDLTAWNVVRRVTVDGRPARFAVDAKHSKLAITPPRGIRDGRRFRTVVRYGGIQRPFPGTTGLKEGWIADPEDRGRRRRPADRCDGLVPQQQRSRRQGDLHDPHHRSSRLERAGHRRLGLPTRHGARQESQEHVRLEGGRADVDLPRVGLGGQVRRQLAGPGQAEEDHARRGEPQQAAAVLHRDHRIAARRGQGAVGRRSRPLVRDRRLLLLLLRKALPVHVAGRDRHVAVVRPQPRDPGQADVRHHQDRRRPTDQGSRSSPTSSRISCSATS